MQKPLILITKPSKDYELLDSGDGKKLERYGSVVLARPDPQALWDMKNKELWKTADAEFVRDGKKASWKEKKELPKNWTIDFADLKFVIRPTSFKHTGLFPEQSENWKWTEQQIKNAKRSIKVLNLFGYTGGATLACAKAGAEVVHLDGSKTAIAWARENAEASGLVDAPIRWILDDAREFLKREVKRGNKYDAIIMDPPAFGYGPNDELWKIEEHFTELLTLCKKVLSNDPLFVIINGYASGYSPIAYQNNLGDMMHDYNGEIEIGELTIAESGSTRLLPCGIFARWYTRK